MIACSIPRQTEANDTPPFSACYFGAGIKSAMLRVGGRHWNIPESQKPTASPSESAQRGATYSNSVSWPNANDVTQLKGPTSCVTMPPKLARSVNRRLRAFLGAAS